MMVRIQMIENIVTGFRCKDGVYLKSYDPEAHGGAGEITLTDKPDHALQLADVAEAHMLWATIPKCLPLRPDGKPNRPLTAWTVSYERG
jgi:hypothetical protein